MAEPTEFARVRGAVRRQWKLVVSLTLALGLVGVLWACLAPRVYRVEIVLAPVSERDAGGNLAQIAGQFAGVASMLGVNLAAGGMGKDEDVAIATLQSRKFAADFIREEGLLPILYASRWNAETGQWRSSPFSRPPTYSRAADFFNERVRSVSKDRKTGLVRLVVEWHDPQLAAEWADKMVRRVNEEMRRRAVSEANASIRYLNSEAKKTDVLGAEQAIYRLLEAQINRVMFTNVRQEFAFQTVDPAMIPDPRDYVRPRPGVAVGLGLLAGLALGVLLALLRASRRSGTAHS